MRLTKVFSWNFYPNHFVRLQRAAHSSVWYRAILLRFLFQLHFKVQWNLDLTNLYLTNDILCPGESYSKMYGIEPRCNEYNPEAQTQNLPRYNELQCQHATEDKGQLLMVSVF